MQKPNMPSYLRGQNIKQSKTVQAQLKKTPGQGPTDYYRKTTDDGVLKVATKAPAPTKGAKPVNVANLPKGTVIGSMMTSDGSMPKKK